ncbi:MAG: TetR/AcrR family transcriptional regulator [Moraxellaceae bacterium]|nr:MAG: TetR/AcrR family transcriptional regulator [Moraxellaceae bacterium]
MPRNHRTQDREEKRNLIIDAAQHLFLREGYEATAMTRLAKAASIAANTIYWYFKDKDDVLIAVLDRELSVRLADYLKQSFSNMTERLLWVVNQLELVSPLVSTVHARAQLAPAIHGWHEQFHHLIEALLRVELEAAGIPADRIEAVMNIWVFTIEGLLTHPMSASQKQQICQTLSLGIPQQASA